MGDEAAGTSCQHVRQHDWPPSDRTQVRARQLVVPSRHPGGANWVSLGDPPVCQPFADRRNCTCRHDDLIEEESDTVQAALKRLSPKESYDRVFRIRRAVMCSYQHKLLPKDQWVKPEEVLRLSLQT
jgi:hypothetical protein